MNSRLGSLTQISEINDHLYLSGALPVRPDRVVAKRINCIVNVTLDEPSLYLPGVDYLKIRIDDSPLAQLDAYFDMVADRIRGVKEKGGRVLVHCVAGVSRSASLCIVYLMKYERLNLRQAYQHVKNCRPIIRPNPGFWRQMIEFEKRLFGQVTVKMVTSRWGDLIPDVYTDELKPPQWVPLKQTVTPPPVPKRSSSSKLRGGFLSTFYNPDFLLQRSKV